MVFWLLLLCKLYACLYCFPCVTLVKLASVGVMPIKFLNLESYRKILRSLEAARLVFRIVRSLLNLTDTSATLLPRCLSNFKTIWWFKLTISRLRDFTRSYNKMSYCILKHSPGYSGPDNGSWVTCPIVIWPNPITYNLAMRVTYACWVGR